MLKRLRMQMLRIRHVDASGESQSNVAINQREREGEKEFIEEPATFAWQIQATYFYVRKIY